MHWRCVKTLNIRCHVTTFNKDSYPRHHLTLRREINYTYFQRKQMTPTNIRKFVELTLKIMSNLGLRWSLQVWTDSSEICQTRKRDANANIYVNVIRTATICPSSPPVLDIIILHMYMNLIVQNGNRREIDCKRLSYLHISRLEYHFSSYLNVTLC